MLNEEKMNNNVLDVVENAPQAEIEDEITSQDFNEEDFDEGPGPGVYFPQQTMSKR